ncbi:MAG: hypothetical protein QGF90_02875 [Gammaproteobacteria bacterium]|nr:hypothetical protein [Gammaproteobacteria bacterium]
MITLRKLFPLFVGLLIYSNSGLSSADQVQPVPDMNQMMQMMMGGLQSPMAGSIPTPGQQMAAPSFAQGNPMTNPMMGMGGMAPMMGMMPMMMGMGGMNPMMGMMPMMSGMGNPMTLMTNPKNWANPGTYAQFMQPNAYTAMMNPMSYMAFMNPATYAAMMNPGAYMQFANPTTYGAMMDPNAYMNMMSSMLGMAHAGDSAVAQNFWEQWKNLGMSDSKSQ